MQPIRGAARTCDTIRQMIASYIAAVLQRLLPHPLPVARIISHELIVRMLLHGSMNINCWSRAFVQCCLQISILHREIHIATVQEAQHSVQLQAAARSTCAGSPMLGFSIKS